MERENPYKDLPGRKFVTNEFGRELEKTERKYSHLGKVYVEKGLFPNSVAVYIWEDEQMYWGSKLAKGLEELNLPIQYAWEGKTTKTKNGKKDLSVSFSNEYNLHRYLVSKQEIIISTKRYERSHKDSETPQIMARWFLHELGHAETPTIVIFKFLPFPINKIANLLYEIPAEVYTFKKLGSKKWLDLSFPS